MYKILFYLLLIKFILFSDLNAILWFDDEELHPSESGLYTHKQHKFSVVPKDKDVSILFVGDHGEVVIQKQPSKSIKPPLGQLLPKERINALKDRQEKILFEETWLSNVSRSATLKKLGIQVRTIRYSTQESIDVKFEGPSLEHRDGATNVKMNVVSAQDPQRILGCSLLGTVPFKRTLKPEPGVRYVAPNGAFQEVETYTEQPDIKNIQKVFGVEEAESPPVIRRVKATGMTPLWGSYDTYKSGYVKVEEVNSEEHQDHPLHTYIDEQGNYHGIFYKYWNVRKEDEKDDAPSTSLVALHVSPLMMNLFETCIMTGDSTTGYYEILPEETKDGVVRTTLKMIMGNNHVHFDRQSDVTTHLHFLDLSTLEPTPASAKALLQFARMVKQPTTISYVNSKRNEEDLRKQGDLIHKFLEGYLTWDDKLPNPYVQINIDAISTSLENLIGPYDFRRFKAMGIKKVNPDWVYYTPFEEFNFIEDYLNPSSPILIIATVPLSENDLRSLRKVVKGNKRLRGINFSSALEKVDPSSSAFRFFMRELLDTPVKTIAIDKLSLPNWEKANFTAKEIHKLFNCIEAVSVLDISNAELPNRTKFRQMLSRSKETLRILGMKGVKNFSEGHFQDLCTVLKSLEKIEKVYLQDVFLTSTHISALKAINNTFSFCYTPASLVAETVYDVLQFVKVAATLNLVDEFFDLSSHYLALWLREKLDGPVKE